MHGTVLTRFGAEARVTESGSGGLRDATETRLPLPMSSTTEKAESTATSSAGRSRQVRFNVGEPSEFEFLPVRLRCLVASVCGQPFLLLPMLRLGSKYKIVDVVGEGVSA